ncbi:RNA methyltransferase [Fulvivirgaceae bacterium PWU5]|uniref:RNA methyltransferase n=1 Tax=Dawidia cretensis TaxID=2782350 RepID=A0AAP2DVX4_9BACT|nr:RNA methyltransferase [Dawidia cretensis]MBT1708590.1 RNA methyltransferase [Dawidia cretensis]
MLSKARIKFIKSLQLKKYRKQEQCFVVQGAKSVQELLHSDFETLAVLGTAEFLATCPPAGKAEVLEVSPKALEELGEFQSNDAALAVARLKPNNPLTVGPTEFALALDDIRDPGNLGTILRTADWYGIRKIIASSETADFYNAKVISATMGSFTRVQVYYTDLETYLPAAGCPVFGAFLNGSNVHMTSFGPNGIVLIGNESRGISDALAPSVTHKVTIPRYGQAESLNAAIATAIICDNLARGRHAL